MTTTTKIQDFGAKIGGAKIRYENGGQKYVDQISGQNNSC